MCVEERSSHRGAVVYEYTINTNDIYGGSAIAGETVPLACPNYITKIYVVLASGNDHDRLTV